MSNVPKGPTKPIYILDALFRRLADLLPRRLVYFAAIRLMSHEGGNTDTCIEALKRWNGAWTESYRNPVNQEAAGPEYPWK